MQHKISIIVPVYNASQTLSRCVNSLLNQEYANTEIILINDGSSDNSASLCDAYALQHSSVKVFHQKNQGVSQARNKGIEESTGDYILFVDSDDYLEPNCLSTLLALPPADITYMSSNVHYSTGDFTSYHLSNRYCTKKEDIENEILHLKCNPQGYVYFGYTWNKLFKASIIREHHIRFIKGLSFYEDDAFTLEFFKHATSLRTLSDSLYNYVITVGGLTMAANSCEEFEMLVNANALNAQFIRNRELLSYEYQRLFQFLLQGIQQARRQGRRHMYKHLVKRAHTFYLQYIRPNRIPIRKVYKRSNYFFFWLSIILHKH